MPTAANEQVETEIRRAAPATAFVPAAGILGAVAVLLLLPAAAMFSLPARDVDTVVGRLLLDPDLRYPSTMLWLRDRGEAVKPELDSTLRNEDPSVRAAAVQAYARVFRDDLGPIADMVAHDAVPAVRVAALGALATQAAELKKALPAALDLVRDKEIDPSLRSQALMTLIQNLGPTQVPSATIVDLLLDATENTQVRWYAAFALRGPTDADMARLVEGMRTGDATTRRGCCQAVVQTGLGTPAALSILAAGIGDPQPAVVAAAAQALGKLGNKARSVAPALRDAILAKKPNPGMRLSLLGRLLAVGLDADMVTDEFRALGGSRDPRVRTIVRQIIDRAR